MRSALRDEEQPGHAREDAQAWKPRGSRGRPQQKQRFAFVLRVRLHWHEKSEKQESIIVGCVPPSFLVGGGLRSRGHCGEALPPPPLVDGQTRAKTLPSRNFVSGRLKFVFAFAFGKCKWNFSGTVERLFCGHWVCHIFWSKSNIRRRVSFVSVTLTNLGPFFLSSSPSPLTQC